MVAWSADCGQTEFAAACTSHGHAVPPLLASGAVGQDSLQTTVAVLVLVVADSHLNYDEQSILKGLAEQADVVVSAAG